jgi:hypothetical protein
MYSDQVISAKQLANFPLPLSDFFIFQDESSIDLNAPKPDPMSYQIQYL